MRKKIQELYRDAVELPERDRAELAGMLIESLDGPPDEGVEVASISRMRLSTSSDHATSMRVP